MTLTTPRSKWAIVASICIPWVAAPFVLKFVVERNAREHLYGIADQTIIPFAWATFLFVLGLPYFALLMFLTLRQYQPDVPIASFQLTWSHFGTLLLIFPGVLFLAFWIAYWFDRFHFPIIIVYSVPIWWLFWVRPLIAEKGAA